jgi:hypothetical protein
VRQPCASLTEEASDDYCRERACAQTGRDAKKAGENHGLLVVAGNVVIRDGVNGTDSPMMFDIRVLENAIALELLEPRKVSGSVAWDSGTCPKA